MAVSRDQAFQQYNNYLMSLGASPNSDTAHDFEGLYNQSSDYSQPGGVGLDNPSGSWDQLFAQYQPTLKNRWTRPTQSAGGVGGSADVNGDGVADPHPQYPSDNGAAATQAQLDALLESIRGMNAQPDVDLSGIAPGDFPVFEVPGENLSPAIDDTLLSAMSGEDPLGLGARFSSLLDSTAGGGRNSQRLALRNEQAREQLTRGEQAALADMSARLGDRGLIGLPGSPEGSELDMTQRVFEPLQREYLSQLREAQIQESELADQHEIAALEQASGWQRGQLDARLAAANSGTQRQQILSDVALGVLDRNIEWNKFLATFGLQREQVAEQIRQGRIDNITPLIQMFLSLITQSRGGFV